MSDQAEQRRLAKNARQRKWVEANRDSFNKRRRELRATNPQYAETDLKWKALNKDRVEETHRKYYSQNRKKLIERTSEYQRENKERMNKVHYDYRDSPERYEITRVERLIRGALRNGTNSPLVEQQTGWTISDYRVRLEELWPGYSYGKVGFSFQNYLSEIEGKTLREIFDPARLYLKIYVEGSRKRVSSKEAAEGSFSSDSGPQQT